MEILPINSKLILDGKNCNSNTKSESGAIVPTDFVFTKVLYGEFGDIKPGDNVCVPKNKVSKIPIEGEFHLLCYGSEIAYKYKQSLDGELRDNN